MRHTGPRANVDRLRSASNSTPTDPLLSLRDLGDAVRAPPLGVLVLLLGALASSPASAQTIEPVAFLFGDYDGLDPGTDALVILEPRIGFSDDATRQIDGFLEAGGRVLVAGLRGSGGELLDRLDAGIRVEQASLFSLGTGGPPLVEGATAWSDVPDLVLDGDPPALNGTGQPLLVTHEFTWLDRDADGEPDLDEPRGRFPVAMQTPVGRGGLLVLSTAGLVNETAPAVVQAHIQAWLHEDMPRRIVLDARHTDAARLGTVGRLLSDDTWPPVLVASAAVVGLVVALGVRVRRRPTAPRRVRPLPPARSGLEARAVEELPP